MKFTIPYVYREDIIPPRCRKPRSFQFSALTTISIPEITSGEAPVAIICRGWYVAKHNQGEWTEVYRWYKGTLYTKTRRQDSSGAPYYIETADKFLADRELNADIRVSDRPHTSPEASQERKRATASYRDIVFIDGERWTKTEEPRYVVMTFGLGHNHGGTSLMTDNSYNQNIHRDCYYRIDQVEVAVAARNRLATQRGDTQSLDLPFNTFQIILPEAVRLNPSKEHGTGDPFINQLNRITSAAPSTGAAGILVLAKTFEAARRNIAR